MRSHLCRRPAAPPSHRVAWDAGLKETRPSTWPHFTCHPQPFYKLARSSAASSAPAAASQTPHLAAPELLWLDSTARLAPGLRQLESVAGCARLSPPDGPCRRRRRRCHRPATAAMSLANKPLTALRVEGDRSGKWRTLVVCDDIVLHCLHRALSTASGR